MRASDIQNTSRTVVERKMMGIGRKKVIVRTIEAAALAGYLPASGMVRAGVLELLDPAGRTVSVPLENIRYVAYVRDFNLGDHENPERLSRRSFLARPRTEGLWVRAVFHDGEALEGLAALDLALLEDAFTDEGVFLIPPDVRSNTQRVYIPRISLAALQVLGVITTPSKTAAALGKPAKHEAELDLPFPEV